jgi:outer membrane lipoprotein-sorting protein
MRRSLVIVFLTVFFGLPISLLAQQSTQTATTPARDPQAVAVLQQSFAAMGKTLPADSVATGTVTIVEGSRTEEGTIRVATRGPDQSIEDITTSSDHRVVVYTQLLAAETKAGATKLLSFEASATSQAPDFPLAIIAWALTDPDAAMTYVGLEPLNGQQTHHIRIWNTLNSIPQLQPYAEFTVMNIWIDPSSGLVQKLAYEKREGSGSSPRSRMEIFYSEYQNFGGILYPTQIQKNLNGVLWTTIHISNVTLNTGLKDSDFPLPTAARQQ